MTFKAKVVDYIPDIAHKWDFIGIKLGQSNPVKLLRNSERDDERKLSEILHKWIDSDKFPKTEEKAWRLFCGVLKGPGVQLGSVAREVSRDQVMETSLNQTIDGYMLFLNFVYLSLLYTPFIAVYKVFDFHTSP